MNLKPLALLAALCLAQYGWSQENVPVIKANSPMVTVKADNTLMQYSWQISPKEKLDIYPTPAKRVTFYTDIDSITFNVDPKVGKYDFVILLKGDSAHTQIRYDAAAKFAPGPTIPDLKKLIEGQVYGLKVAPDSVYKIENRSVWNGSDSIPIRIYYPNAKKHQRIIYNIHGGAFVACDLNTHDNISRILANKTQSIVIALDYRKPPDHPYPASLNDCATVLAWITANATRLGGDKRDVIWVGDSGGGLLITALAVKLQRPAMPKAIVLVNPAVDLRHYEHGGYALVCQSYIGDGDPADSLVSPIVASNLSFFPPTLIITCEKDGLKPQGLALYTRLTATAVMAKTVDIPQTGHLAGYWAAGHSKAAPAIDEAVRFIVAQPTD